MWIALAACLLVGFVTLGVAHVYDGGTWSGWARTYPRFIASVGLALGSAALLIVLVLRLV